jgi:hypothetical protein
MNMNSVTESSNFFVAASAASTLTLIAAYYVFNVSQVSHSSPLLPGHLQLKLKKSPSSGRTGEEWGMGKVKGKHKPKNPLQKLCSSWNCILISTRHPSPYFKICLIAYNFLV